MTNAYETIKRLAFPKKESTASTEIKKSNLEPNMVWQCLRCDAIIDDPKWVELVIRNPRYAGDAYAQAESLNFFYNRGTRGTFFGGRLYPGGRPGDIDPYLALALGEAGISLKLFRQSIR